MDKALFRAYVKELVKEQIEESVEKAVKKILPELLAEAVAEVKSVQQSKIVENVQPKPKLDRGKLAAMMGLEKFGDTITATTNNVGGVMPVPPGMSPEDPTIKAINKDYSQMMKAMKLV